MGYQSGSLTSIALEREGGGGMDHRQLLAASQEASNGWCSY